MQERTQPSDQPTGEPYFAQPCPQGSGSVSCSTVVHYEDGSGAAQTATKSAAASGGYNIADAQICSTFDGGWEGC